MSQLPPLVWDDALFKVFKMRQKLICYHLIVKTKSIVQDGPFKDMVYTANEASWGGGTGTSKLLGFYEEELYPLIETWREADYDVVFDVGCAEGFYAVGLARLLPQARVKAYDIDPKAHEVLAVMAEKNGVQDRIGIHGEMTPETLENELQRCRRPLVFCDCEGYEKTLLDPSLAPSLGTTDILVECHDFEDRSITPTLRERFNATHDITQIAEAGRDPNRTPFLSHMNAYDKMIALCELRPERMHWLWLKAKAA